MKVMLTLKAGTSDKFWAVETQGCDVTVRYGRRGTKGVTKTMHFATPAEADAAAAKQCEAKLTKGYEHADADDPGAGNATIADADHRVTPTPSGPVNRHDIGLVGASPFSDGYRIENIPVASRSTSAVDLDAARARFESIAHGVAVENWGLKSATWVFDETPFVDVPPFDLASAWHAWLFSDPLPNREASAVPEEVLTPVLAGVNGLEWALDPEHLPTLRAYTARALMPLVSAQFASTLATRAAEPLPPVKSAYDSQPNDDFVHAGILRRGDAEVVAALDAWDPREHTYGNPSADGHLAHVLLYPSVAQRVAAFRRWQIEFTNGTSPTAHLSAWIHATGREGLNCILPSLDAAAAPLAEALVAVAGAMLDRKSVV